MVRTYRVQAYFWDSVKYQLKQYKIVSQLRFYHSIDHKFSNSKFTIFNRITKLFYHIIPVNQSRTSELGDKSPN